MATAKSTSNKKIVKTTAKKTTPVKKVTENVVESIEEVTEDNEVVEEPIEVEEVVEEPVIENRNFKDTDLIPCLCVFPGSVGMTGKRTGNTYLWEDMGVTEYVEYQDLRTEVLNKKSTYIYKPLFVIEDNEFLAKYPNLVKMYEDIYTPEDIMDKIIDLSPEEMKRFINALPAGIKDSIRNIAATMMNDGSLYDIRKIRIIDNIFGTDLELYSQIISHE